MTDVADGCLKERYERSAPVGQRTSGADEDCGPPLNVLLVEDDDADAYLIRTALGFHPRIGEILRVKDGVEAIELIDAGAFQPDVAFLDLQMPRKDGFGVLLDLKHRAAPFPVVVLSSSRGGPDRLRSAHRGAHMFVTKPKGFAPLYAMFEQVIEGL